MVVPLRSTEYDVAPEAMVHVTRTAVASFEQNRDADAVNDPGGRGQGSVGVIVAGCESAVPLSFTARTMYVTLVPRGGVSVNCVEVSPAAMMLPLRSTL